jgi:hypothetical protein
VCRTYRDAREAVAGTRRRHPFEIGALVVSPDHLHAISTLPPGNALFWAGPPLALEAATPNRRYALAGEILRSRPKPRDCNDDRISCAPRNGTRALS